LDSLGTELTVFVDQGRNLAFADSSRISLAIRLSKIYALVVEKRYGILPPSLNDGRPGSVFVRETRFSRDNHLGTEGVYQFDEEHLIPSFSSSLLLLQPAKNMLQ
jgi:hypothetical protein